MNLYFDTVSEQIAEMAAGDLLRSSQECWQTQTLAYSRCALHHETKKVKSESGPSCRSPSDSMPGVRTGASVELKTWQAIACLRVFSKHPVSIILFRKPRRQKEDSESRYPGQRGLKWGGILYTFFHLDGPYSRSSDEFSNMFGVFF